MAGSAPTQFLRQKLTHFNFNQKGKEILEDL